VTQGDDAPPRRLRVLVVDDEPDVLILLDRVVRSEGYELSGTAANAESAITIDLRDNPDVAVVDYSLPDDTGLAVAESIKAAHPDTFVILFSAQPVGALVLSNPAIDLFLPKTEVNRLPELLEAVARDRGLGAIP
jgi:DNA-binding NarL/FixJ family response regulator